MEIEKLLNQFIIHLEGKGRSHSTIIAYRKDIEQLLTYVNQQKQEAKLADLDTKMLEAYVEHLKQSGKFTLKTVSRKINSLKTFFKYLESEGLIVKNYAEPIEHPDVEPQPPRTLSPLEYRALRDVARNNLRLYTMVELLLQTGIRIGELSRLKRDEAMLEGENPFIKVAEYSSNPARTVELNETITEALERYIAKTEDKKNQEGHLFFTKTGNPVLIRNIRTAINRAFEKAGIKNATVNDIRNTFIVYQLEQGMKIEKLAEIIGHQKPTTTERYLELVEERPKRNTTTIKAL